MTEHRIILHSVDPQALTSKRTLADLEGELESHEARAAEDQVSSKIELIKRRRLIQHKENQLNLTRMTAEEASLDRQIELEQAEENIRALEHSLTMEYQMARQEELHSKLFEVKLSRVRFFFADRDRYATIFDTIFNYLDVKDIFALTRVCKSFAGLYNDSVSHKWNFDKRLSHFVSDPRELRRLLCHTNALIMGSLPLQVFSRTRMEGFGLSILVEHGRSASAVEVFLSAQGYRRGDSVTGVTPFFPRERVTWSRDSRSSKIDIQVIAVKVASPCHRMMGALLEHGVFCTAYSCFITFDAAYCLFPKMTFINKKVMLSSSLVGTHEQVLSIYDKKGWPTGDRLSAQNIDVCGAELDTIGSAPRLRHFGDVHTWTIRLSGVSAHDHPQGWSCLKDYTYNVQPFDSGIDPDHPRLMFELNQITSCLLRKRYICAWTIDPDPKWRTHLHYLLCRLAAMEIEIHLSAGTFTLPQEAVIQPVLEMENMQDSDGDEDDGQLECPLLKHCRQNRLVFKPPISWRYRDSEVSQIYQDWVRVYRSG